MKHYPHLFSPIKIGRLTLKNRICVSPMTITGRGEEKGYFAQDNIDFYENILSRETSPSRRRTIEENLKLMKFYNEVKYVTIVMMIQESDINKFIKTAEQIMNVHECDYDESMHLLEMLNNEII